MRVPQAVWLYCSCRAAQASKGTFTKHFTKPFSQLDAPDWRGPGITNLITDWREDLDLLILLDQIHERISILWTLIWSAHSITFFSSESPYQDGHTGKIPSHRERESCHFLWRIARRVQKKARKQGQTDWQSKWPTHCSNKESVWIGCLLVELQS